ncbi:MAG: VTC domain-containing protein [Deltaproteobacteria bacterium]|nr:VTC domain-containing protein [Deltaproteobacteria bacterium]
MTDATIHQVHRELKYRVDEAEASRLEAIFEREVPLRPRIRGQRETLVRGVYLDFSDHSLTRRSLASPTDNEKVRYRHYESPSLFRGTIEADVMVWLEVKVRKGDVVTKERIAFRGPLMPRLLDGEEAAPEDAPALSALLARGQLQPVVAVRYRRAAFELPDGSLRLTVDRDVAFQRPEHPGHKTPDVGQLGGCVVELKATGGIPGWLSEAMRPHPTSEISKFETAVRATGLATLLGA